MLDKFRGHVKVPVGLNTAPSQQGLPLVEARRRISWLVIARAGKPKAD